MNAELDRPAPPRPPSQAAGPGHLAPDAGERGAPPVPSEHLLQGRKLIEISHNGAVYRLQATRQGKLILTK